MTDSVLLEVESLSVSIRRGQTPLVTDGRLRVRAGEAVAVVGESGSGKSLLARAIMGLLPAGLEASGQVRFRGQDVSAIGSRGRAALRGHDMTMILQDPFTMLNPMRRCGRQLAETLRDARDRPLTGRARVDAVSTALAEVGIDDPTVANRFPHQLSGGMRQRVAIAAAVALNPALLIADEPSTALDVTTQAEVLSLLRSLRERRQMGLVLITHDLRVALSICSRVYVMYAGGVVEVSAAADLRRRPAHPYTTGLLQAEPPMEGRRERMIGIPGSVPAAADVSGQCAFADRCQWVHPTCRHAEPVLRELDHGCHTRCLRIAEIGDELAAELSSSTALADLNAAPIAASDDALVRISALTKTFPAARGKTLSALRGVDLDIGRGESVGLVGESGSGKTTLGRCLVGLETATAGRLVVDGIDASDPTQLAHAQRARLRNAVQLVFQNPFASLNPARTLGATLQDALNCCLSEGRKRTPGELLELVGLPAAYTQRKPVALSGGQRQRVAIARALALEPELVICDEAVSALDLSVQAQILNMLAELRAQLGLGYLFITHDLAVVRQITERVYVLRHGDVVESGPVDRALDDPQHPYTKRLASSVPRDTGTPSPTT